MRVPKEHAGKKGKCPKCSGPIVVPKRQSPAQPASRTAPPDSVGDSKSAASGLTFLDLPEDDKSPDQRTTADKTSDQLQGLEEELAGDEAEPVPERKLPWLIDIFLYPISGPALTILAIVLFVQLLIDILVTLFGPVFGIFVWVPGLVINIIIFFYASWYLCRCIRDSAEGGLRAPDVLVDAPSLGDMAWQTLRLIACLVVFCLPVLIYYQRTERMDIAFWFLLGYAVFFLPMALLALIMFDSFDGLNPFVLVGSIFSTFFQYCGLVLLFCFFGYMLAIFTSRLPWSGFLNYVPFTVIVYMPMVAAHLLGRFYWRYQEKLYWDV
jgi:hypothetical protein